MRLRDRVRLMFGSPEEAARHKLRTLLEHLDDLHEETEWGASEGRLRDTVDAAFRAGTLDGLAVGIGKPRLREIAIEEIERLWTCEHGVRLLPDVFCLECRGITSKDRRMVALIADGLNTEEIAEEMDVSRYAIRDRIRLLRELVGGERMTDLPRLVEQFDRG